MYGARRVNRPVCFVEIQTGIVPGKAAIVQQASGLPGLIGDHVFILDIMNEARDHAVPVFHQAVIKIVILSNLTQVIGVIMRPDRKIGFKQGQTVVRRITLAMYDLGIGQGEFDETYMEVISGHFAGNKPGISGLFPSLVYIFSPQTLKGAGVRLPEVLREPVRIRAAESIGYKPLQKFQFPGPMHPWMTGQYLFHQGGA